MSTNEDNPPPAEVGTIHRQQQTIATSQREQQKIDTTMSDKVDSLPKLIERLREPRGHHSLKLNQADLTSILRYEGIDDFAWKYTEFLFSVLANNTITEFESGGFSTESEKGGVFPIINPLLRQHSASWRNKITSMLFSRRHDSNRPSQREQQKIDATMSDKLDSLPKLIERLQDPSGHHCLKLNQTDLMSILRYEGIDDFAEVYLEFLSSIGANITITEVEIGGFSAECEKLSVFPIVNPLLRHLPEAHEVKLHVVEPSRPVEQFLFKSTAFFLTVRVVDRQESGNDERVLELYPNLDVFEYTTSIVFANEIIGPVLLSLPSPSTLSELHFTQDEQTGCVDSEDGRPFTEPELNRLVEVIQVSTLVNLTLDGILFSSIEECSQFARGLVASPVEDLRLLLFTPDGRNFRDIAQAFPRMPHLESLRVSFELDYLEEIESFSIPVGDIVRGAPGLKSLEIGQGRTPWNVAQCRDLAMALEAPSCGLKTLDLRCFVSKIRMLGAGILMSTFSAPSSSVEEFTCWFTEDDDFDLWLSTLPRTSALRRLAIHYVDDARDPKLPLTDSQQEKFLSIVSGWFYLTDMTTDPEREGFLECFVGEDRRKQLETLLRLNQAGRHYLTSPTHSKADGVEVLVKVRDELNDVYTHLLENPCLCDRGIDTTGRTPSPIRKKARRT